MGHRKKSAPRRGTLGVRPRQRFEGIVPRVRTWPVLEEKKIFPLGFIGYKVGMTHALVVDDRKTSITFGKQIFTPVTLLETPPMILAGIRGYSFDINEGKQPLTEAWATGDTLKNTNIERLIKSFSPNSTQQKLEELEKSLSEMAELRALLLSQPTLAGGISKKKPELIEVGLSGKDLKAQFSYAVEKLGKTIKISEIFNPGKFVDIIAVTKGKGFQGPVKRFGIKVLPRWHKHRKAARKIGARGPGMGALSTAPQAGQMGFHQRVDYNKRILYIADTEGKDKELLAKINPSSGWHKYGLIRTDFVILAGSIPGSRKRPVILRQPVRPPSLIPEGAPKITYLHKIGEL
ncbi:50S ribosomal protein L3 [Fervidicoccus fontis]|uniref:Large ribosomal subunit protein uL3 n=1 Tax=Fervidicoccus fontis TaxID=683846 RepID=A0A2J6NA08_9CREN|nr:50S ribosomal protein L3 [Fervidicoccus fontis]PMB75738.1 MAG: 50S ribosomal protein L3 [Fervidicoccus fontis]PMB78124.1 MAG: 50S ribosomal protein L3 [Fervidicoccus fontis]HEW64190.1 50S ribosomal protein L3 [Fervidicoccus fontis]